MPMVGVITNVSISGSARAELARGLGEAIQLIPGKSESQLMIKIEGESAIYFKGRDDLPVAYVWTDVSGHADGAAYKAFGAAVTRLLGKVLAIPGGNVYLTVREIPVWVVNGE